jgi:hypothetical protein
MNFLSWRSLRLFLLSDVVVFVSHFFLGSKLGFFHLEKEGNLGSFQAGIKFWLAGMAAWLSAWILSRVESAKSRWIIILLVCVGAGLAYIGLDDMMAIHERAGFVINNLLGKGGFYGESFNWLLYFSPFVVLALAVFARLLLWFRKKHPPVFYLFLAGVVLCVFSLGAEWLGGKMIVGPDLDVTRYRQLILLEEAFEMIGGSFLAAALFSLLARLTATHVRILKEDKPI